MANEERKLAAPEPVVKTVKDMLSHPATQTRFREFAPKYLDAERLFKIALMAVHNAPKLGDADPFELLRAMLGVTQLGLEINSPRRQAFLIPFVMQKGTPREKIKIEVVIGYPGWIDLALRSGSIVDVHADVVTHPEVAEEMFKYQLGDEPFLRHIYHPDRDEDRDKPAFTYCVLLLSNGKRVFMVMPWKAVMRIRDRSPGYRAAKAAGANSKTYLGNPWVSDPFAMAAKTVIRRHLKYKQTSADLSSALEIEDRSGQGDTLATFIELDPKEWSAMAPPAATPKPEPESKPSTPKEPAKKKDEPAKKAAKPAKKAAKEPDPKPKEQADPEPEPEPESEPEPAARNEPEKPNEPNEPGAREPDEDGSDEAPDDDPDNWMKL